MSNNYKSVLIKIVQLSNRDGEISATSLTHLRQNYEHSTGSLKNILTILERDGLIYTENPNSRTTLIYPTMQALDRVAKWKKGQQDASIQGRITASAKNIFFALLGIAIPLLVWYFGFSKDQLEPIASRDIPFSVYNQWTSTIINENERLSYSVVNDSLNADEIYNPDESIAATLDGRFVLWFDIESDALNHQINIEEINIEIERQEPPDVTEIEETFHGLGGGEIREYEVSLAATNKLPLNEVTLVRAEMVVDKNSVDFVFLRPKERETISVVINLSEPGRYRITPILKYAFQDIVSEQRLGTSVVYFPNHYRYWYVKFNDVTERYDVLPVENIIVNTKSHTFYQPEPYVFSRQSCLSLDKWVAFVSRISPDDHRLFVMSLVSGQIEMLTGRLKRPHILGWDTTGTLYFIEDQYYTSQDGGMITDYYGWKPNLGTFPVELNNVPEGLFRQEINNVQCLLGYDLCLDTPKLDTNGSGTIDDQDKDQIALVDRYGNVVKRLGYSNRYQSEPILSPDQEKFVYHEGSGCFPSNPEYLFAMDIDGTNFSQLTWEPSDHLNVWWSPDSKFLVYASNKSPDGTECDDRHYQIYRLDPQGGAEIKITEDYRSDKIFEWSSNGEYVLVGGNFLSLAKVDGSCHQPIFPSFFEGTYFVHNSAFVEAVIQP